MMTEEVQMMGPLALKEETVELVPLQEEELVAMAAGHLEVLQLPMAVELGHQDDGEAKGAGHVVSMVRLVVCLALAVFPMDEIAMVVAMVT